MKRGAPLARRTPLARGGRLERRTPLRAFGRRGGAVIAYAQVRRDVEARSGGRCELRTPECAVRGSECHHLLPRSAGGPDDLGNCVWVCAPCHRYLHAHPAEAYEHGWLRRRAS